MGDLFFDRVGQLNSFHGQHRGAYCIDRGHGCDGRDLDSGKSEADTLRT